MQGHGVVLADPGLLQVKDTAEALRIFRRSRCDGVTCAGWFRYSSRGLPGKSFLGQERRLHDFLPDAFSFIVPPNSSLPGISSFPRELSGDGSRMSAERYRADQPWAVSDR
jgi:hypothetical protein